MSTVGAMSTDGWLPLALPADGETFRTSLVDVAETLALAGGSVVDDADADAVVSATPLRGDPAAWLVVTDLKGVRPAAGPLRRRLGPRVRSAMAAASYARGVQKALAREKYARIDSMLWDYETIVSLTGARWDIHEARQLPRGATIVGRRDSLAPTIWERAVAESSAAHRSTAPLNPPRVTGSGLSMTMDRGAVFRCAVGPAGDHIRIGARMAERLRRDDVPAHISRLIPVSIAEGSTGIGWWTLERRMAGTMPTSLSPSLFAELVDVIADTFGALATGERRALTTHAAVIDRYWQGAPLTPRAADVDALLAHVPAGFTHGDLWRGNLLVSGSKLVGIVDWVRAGDGRMPLGDFFHLSTAENDAAGQAFGITVVSELLPWARAGGDEIARGLCGRLGFEPTVPVLEALVLAYWYDRAATELGSYRDRSRNPVWLESNIGTVADALAAGA